MPKQHADKEIIREIITTTMGLYELEWENAAYLFWSVMTEIRGKDNHVKFDDICANIQEKMKDPTFALMIRGELNDQSY